jgi:hypothetical protein
MFDVLSPEKVALIRELNDRFRTSFQGGQIVLTEGVATLPDMVKASALLQVRDFQNFTKDNDPAQEHDFLSFELCHRKFYFKIDYYDLKLQGLSEDPSDPAITRRIGTLMLAAEY